MKKTAHLFRASLVFSPVAMLSIAASVLSSSPALAQQPRLMTNNVRSVVANHEVQRLRALPATQTLKLSIALPLQNEGGLDELLQQLWNPASPAYHHWLSVDEFTHQFGPTQADYETVVRYAEAHGMTVRSRTANRLVLGVTASVAQINQAFHVTMGEYQHPHENRTFYAPDRQPTPDLPVKIWHIEGLDNYSIPRPAVRRVTESAIRTVTSGSGPGGQFLGSDIRAAYYGGSALTGAGQSIGLFGFGYNISDVQRYFSNVGQPFNPAVIQNYATDGSTNSCGSGCNDLEPIVDIISALSMAPGVNAVIEYFGTNAMDNFNAMATANVAKQLSVSLLYSPADPNTEEPFFKEMAAQGQSLFVGSGDEGAWDSSQAFEYPPADPYVTAVGGTDLTTNGAGGSWQSETAWGGSSGGINDQNFAIPSYQQAAGVINSANGGSTTLRNAPDVAAEANVDNWVCANGNPCGGGIGGTSLAAPRWAGFMALVNQQAANNGDPYVGFLNPIIYSIGTSSSYSADFHDITSGNNANSTASYNAVSGYDLVTGWGSPNGQALIDKLAPPRAANLNGAHVLAPASSPGLVLDDSGANTGSGNRIQVWSTNGTGAQSWVFSNNNVQPAGYYNIAVSLGPYCATASGSGSGSPVNLQPCNGSAAQAWQAVAVGSRFVFHPANNTGLCMDVDHSGTTSGTLVQVWSCNGTNAQSWALQ